MNRMRLRIAERLKQSQNTAASLTTFNEVDMSNIMEFRKLYKEETLKKTGVKLGFMSAFSRAAVLRVPTEVTPSYTATTSISALPSPRRRVWLPPWCETSSLWT
jgi:pyruvate/2-oxoglutarate dehydrogenase complex dihydrolipoamide acyltransferase (E2) component